jgi:hypothetical protein
MVEVPPLPLHLQVRRGEQLYRFASAVAALLAPGYAALGSLETTLRTTIPAGVNNALAIRQRSEGSEAKINARLLAGSGCMGTSAQEKQAYQPSASLPMVTVLRSSALLRTEYPGEAFTHVLEGHKPIQYCKAGKLNGVAHRGQRFRRTLSFLWVTRLGIKLRGMLVHQSLSSTSHPKLAEARPQSLASLLSCLVLNYTLRRRITPCCPSRYESFEPSGIRDLASDARLRQTPRLLAGSVSSAG